ncbi:uncharacterized protein [Diadema antillarum]|uniref:uncharacterized protein n=1 Tax=Diadema antillarum TaxID=105358 RepID=UPI003A84633A
MFLPGTMESSFLFLNALTLQFTLASLLLPNSKNCVTMAFVYNIISCIAEFLWVLEHFIQGARGLDAVNLSSKVVCLVDVLFKVSFVSLINSERDRRSSSGEQEREITPLAIILVGQYLLTACACLDNYMGCGYAYFNGLILAAGAIPIIAKNTQVPYCFFVFEIFGVISDCLYFYFNEYQCEIQFFTSVPSYYRK